jgi:glycosyltransferase involved in cell wall biosynthesis
MRGVAQRRIVHILWALEDGGAPIYQLVREQRRQGAEADVLVASKGGLYAERTREAGARVHELGQRRAFDATKLRQARAVLREYDIAHFHATEPLLIGLAAHQPDLRCVYTHRAGFHEYSFRKQLRHSLIRHYLKSGFAVTANTHQSARAASVLFGIRSSSISVIHNGLDFELLEPHRPRAEILLELGALDAVGLRIGTAAILRRLKRVDLLIHAVAAMEIDPVKCLIFGDGPARAELEQLVHELGLEDKYLFLGHKSNLPDYLQTLDIFVLPSGPEEAFGNAAVEAMAIGIPTIVFSDGGGLTEHIESGVTGFVVRDKDELTERLVQLSENARLRRELGTAGRAAVRRRYSVDAMVTAYDALYTRLQAGDDTRVSRTGHSGIRG